MDYITTSFFDIFKIGPGPSSSHTIGPMQAAYDFRQNLLQMKKEEIKKATHIEVLLFGSLSATGKGHGTDKAILAGLLGCFPEKADPEEISNYFSKDTDSYDIIINDFVIKFNYESFFFEEVHHLYPFSNTMILRLKTQNNKTLLEKEYYSIGGGFIKSKGEKEKPMPKLSYTYCCMDDLKKVLKKENISLIDLLVKNEVDIAGKCKNEIYAKLSSIIAVMERSVAKGIASDGILPGPIKLARKAKKLYEAAKEEKDLDVPDRFLIYLDAYAIAASEENAMGNLVVTAPTSGASGVIPSIIMLLKHYFHTDEKMLCEGLMVAALIAFIAKHNASISGAEVGCQGEVGVAAAMGAALVAYVDGCDIDVIESAAEIALEHQLGLTCDPILGYVQIPCIERNAVAAVDAYNAFLLASSGDVEKQKISFDQVVEVMLQTGRDMCLKYKETSKGGLALCDIEC